VLIGVMGGALIGGTIADRIGRRKTLIWGAILFIIGSILAPLSPNVYVLFIARALLGIAVGFTSVTAPVYVSELAPPKSRGMLIGLYQFALTSGIAIADLVGYWFAASQGWRLMFAFGLIPAVIFLLMVLTVPESPVGCSRRTGWLRRNRFSARIPMWRVHACSWKTFAPA